MQKKTRIDDFVECAYNPIHKIKVTKDYIQKKIYIPKGVVIDKDEKTGKTIYFCNKDERELLMIYGLKEDYLPSVPSVKEYKIVSPPQSETTQQQKPKIPPKPKIPDKKYPKNLGRLKL